MYERARAVCPRGLIRRLDAAQRRVFPLRARQAVPRSSMFAVNAWRHRARRHGVSSPGARDRAQRHSRSHACSRLAQGRASLPFARSRACGMLMGERGAALWINGPCVRTHTNICTSCTQSYAHYPQNVIWCGALCCDACKPRRARRLRRSCGPYVWKAPPRCARFVYQTGRAAESYPQNGNKGQ